MMTTWVLLCAVCVRCVHTIAHRCLAVCAVDHSIVLYFMDKDGQFLEFFTQITEADEIVDKITAVIKRQEAAGKAGRK